MSTPLPQVHGERRPIAARSQGWAQATARALRRWGFSPNAVSLLSIVCALAAGACLLMVLEVSGWQRSLLLIGAALGMVGRLLCNLFDGMIAVEGGRGGPLGPLFNEVPDRISDSVIFIALGYGLAPLPWAVDLGWAAALAALLTAYVRAMGSGLGRGDCFHGPMAKQQRMALLILVCLAAAAVPTWEFLPWILWSALPLVVVGSVLTAWRRLSAIGGHLRRPPQP